MYIKIRIKKNIDLQQMECVVNQKVGKLRCTKTLSAKIKNTVSNNGCNAERRNQHWNKKTTAGTIIKTGVQISEYAPNTQAKPENDQKNFQK